MYKDKSPGHSGGLPPPSSRFSSFSPPGSSFNVKPEPSSSAFPPMAPGNSSDPSHFGHGSDASRFSHDISRMPDNPPKNIGHRRAHSEILTLPDDISFDSDLGVVGGADGPSFSDETEEDLLSMYLDMDKFNSTSATSVFQLGESSTPAPAAAPAPAVPANVSVGPSERPRVRHQHSHQWMDRPLSSQRCSYLVQRTIWANRQSAARSKERKMRYIAELERKVQTLQTEATSLSAQLTLLQRDTNGLTAENSELKLRLQTMEQQVHLQDALNDALKEEIQHLKVMTGQTMPNGGPMMNFASFGAGQQFYPNNQAMHTLLTTQQFQQLQIQSQKQQHQIQQHQLHQLQQQQQEQQQQQQRVGDLKLRGTMPSPNQKDNASDINPPTND
ncbi:hypothetical protein GH714_011161 [Hevea brasiliensis]|uniref:BZIP domain-containing protein n=1 Tax=Hevea brasiliensis TaxID=3981 RepID=A0A6A6LFP7_HEVBR|nr:hypothetical protein GH714_011161 [Hevea brasiliensis]